MLAPSFEIDQLPASPDRLRVKFQYDPAAVNLIKTVPGRRYHPDQKFWSIPSYSLRNLQSTASRVGVLLVFSEKVRQALEIGQKVKDDLTETKRQADVSLDLPTQTQVRDYQRVGIRYLLSALENFHGALLADDCGLGKCLMSLSLLVDKPDRFQKVLILCPSTLKWNWLDEVEKHYPQLLPRTVVVDGDAEQRKKAWGSDVGIFISGYDVLVESTYLNAKGTMVKRGDREPKTISWDLVICDEVQACKSWDAKRTKAVKKLHRRHSLGLSGTPIENRLEELHSIMDFCMPGLLGPGWLFVQEHCIKNIYGAIVGYRGIEQVKARIQPHYLRRLKADVLTELPPKIYSNIMLEMSDEEWTVYDAIKEQIEQYIDANDKLSASNILVQMLRLKQVVAMPSVLGENVESSKLKALEEILEIALAT